MVDINFDELIPPFADYLARGTEHKTIKSALEARKEQDGIILQRWYEDGTKLRLRPINELDDLLGDKPDSFVVAPQAWVDQVTQWDRALKIGLERLDLYPEEVASDLNDNRDLSMSISKLGLQTRTMSPLWRSDLRTVGAVLEKEEMELLDLRNFGRKSFDDLRQRLVANGYTDPWEKSPAPIVQHEEDEDDLGVLGRALRETLKEIGDDDLLGADDED